MIFKSDTSHGDLNGFLDAGSHIRGELHFEDTFRIDGKLSGKVVSSGDLVVGENAELEADVEVGRIYVSGVVRGSIKAARYIEIAANAKVYADLNTPSLTIENGAFFTGHCTMERQAPKVVAHPARPKGSS